MTLRHVKGALVYIIPSEARRLAARFLARYRLLDSGEDTKEKGTRNDGGARKRKKEETRLSRSLEQAVGFYNLVAREACVFPTSIARPV